MLHDQSPSTGLIGSVMTKAISIETALHVSLPAEWPAAPVDVPSFWWSELIAINFTKAANNNFALQRDENTSRLNLPPQTTIKLCGCIRIAEQSILYWSVLTLGGVRHRRLIYQERKKRSTDVITTCLDACLKSAIMCPVRWRSQTQYIYQTVEKDDHLTRRWTLLPSGDKMRH